MAACLRAQAAQEPRCSLAALLGVSPLSREAKDLYPYALGELQSAVALAALGSQWMVANSTTSVDGIADAEHIALGPAGIFYICSRQHSSARIVSAGRMIMVNGRRVAYVRDAMIGADRATTALANLGADGVSVNPIVVLSGASEFVRGRMRAPVPVLHLGDLAGWLLRQPAIYSPAVVRQLVSAAGQLSGWQVHPSAASASVRLTARFERLRAEVDAARRRYRLWVVAGATIALAATVTMLVFVAPLIADVLSR
ncbi:hypothetical protein A20C1_01221 [marine actinobacterium PHSC20C1]|nr:hypothetical protein A20C1_01221 [marine actinobacterium PHSC20C1]